MERRTFIKKAITAGTLVLGAGALWPSCTRNPGMERMDSKKSRPAIPHITPETYEILAYASLAPSGHNSQPWAVRILNETEWIVMSDDTRWLPVVDPDNRETLLSIGAFIENIVTASAAYGFDAHVDILADTAFDRDIARITLEKTTPRQVPLRRMVLRRTVKSHMLPQAIAAADISAFEKKAGQDLLHYFPRGSSHAALMDREAIDNIRIQTKNDRAQEELASWIRFRQAAIERQRDGITPAGMEIEGIGGWVVRHFMSPENVMDESFRRKGIEKAVEQISQGGGWMAITSRSDSAADRIDAGRRFQRMALIARERNIAIHPMSQTLEEKHGQANLRAGHKPDMIPQFMLRVGYVRHYPDPVSPRRPVPWFVRAA